MYTGVTPFGPVVLACPRPADLCANTLGWSKSPRLASVAVGGFCLSVAAGLLSSTRRRFPAAGERTAIPSYAGEC